jgi:hypothetical protein
MTLEQLNSYATMLVSKLEPWRGFDVHFTPFATATDAVDATAELWLKRPEGGGAGGRITISPFDGDDRQMVAKLEREIWREYLTAKKNIYRCFPVKMSDFNGFTLRKLWDLVGGEAEAWECYFSGGMSPEVCSLFENAQQPAARTIAVLMRGFQKAEADRRLVERGQEK